MPLVVNTNIASLIAQRNLTQNTTNVNRSLERMSSGYRINRAADDAAGLTISETLRSDIRGMKMALQNVQDGVSMLQIAEGALSVVGENLQRVRELTVQAANDTNSPEQRDAIESEIQARLQDNERIASAINFNGIKLLDGSTLSARLQIGANSNINEDTINITNAFATTTGSAMGLFNDGVTPTSAGWNSIASIDFTTGSRARAFLTDIDNALSAISARRSEIGAYQNQLESVVSNLTLGVENFTASESKIRDLDMAAEMASQVKNQILQQAAVSILSQANQAPTLVMSLLRQ